MKPSKAWRGHLAIALLTVALAALATAYWTRQYELMRKHYVANASADTRFVADKVQAVFGSMYDKLRTLSLLPSVRAIGRHGENLSDEARVMIHQVYGNLTKSIAVSELYFVPIDFDPERIDPATGRREAPIAVFNQAVVGGRSAYANIDRAATPEALGADHVDIFEFQLIKRQLDWLSANYPTVDKIDGPKAPLVGGPAVVTSDNSVFDKTGREADRAGVVELVPLYGVDGKLRGGVAAVVRSDALRDLLPGNDYALVNTRYDFMTSPKGPGQAAESANWVRQGLADPALIYSEAAPVKSADGESRWMVWAGHPDDLFENSSGTAGVRHSAVVNVIAVALLGLAASALFSLIAKNIRATALAVESGRREAHLARTDFLTGLPNRLALSEILPEMLADNLARGGSVGLVAIDLDGFKEINDTLGHDGGDAALVAVGERLRASYPHCPLIRAGGDEFVMLVPCVAPEHVKSVADGVAEALKLPVSLGGVTAALGGSVGFATAPRDGSEPEDLLRRSDLALFRAKRDARGQAVAFDAGLEAAIVRRRMLEAALRRALQHDAIEVAYQPILDKDGVAVVGVEALARWTDEAMGPVSPAEFIPLAEDSGLIVQLGEQVLRRALEDASAWPGLALSVNVSAQQIHKSDVAALVEALLIETGFPGSRLELEVTESMLISDEARADAQIKRLQKLGVKVALDDFGTGFASLLYLRQFGFDRLKIDRQFVKDSDTSAEARAMIVSITTMSRALGLEVTAEGVENDEQRLFLQSTSCDRLQGYLFSRPIPAERLARLLERLSRETIVLVKADA